MITGKFLNLVRILVLGVGLFVITASNGFAQDVSVEAELSSRKIALGSAIQFTITVHGANNVDPVQLPPIDGFDVRYLGPSTRVSIVNGQYSSSKSFVYSLFPKKEGQFTIPQIDVLISGKTYTLQSVPVEVVRSLGPVTSSQHNQPASLEDQLFIVIKVPKKEVYLNESLPIKILLFVSELSARDIQFPELNNIGFTMGEYEKPMQYQQVVNGIRYNIVEFNTVIYPTREGELQLGPAKVECNLIVQSPQSASRFGRGSIFDDDFFNSFFDQHEKRPIVLESKQVTLNVLPLPEEGKPEDFSGAVGQFSFNVSVSPDKVKEGDPLTLRMTVVGKGNPASIQMPSLPSGNDFKLYDPQIFEKDNIKKSEQVIIPQSEQITEVPAVSFSYFDPQLKKYRTITKGPFPVQVEKLEDQEAFKVVGLGGKFKPVVPETLGQDIVFIKASPGKLNTVGGPIYTRPVFYLFIFLFGLLWGGLFLNFKRTRRMKTDIVYARRLLAPRQAKQGLIKVKDLIRSGKKEEFYNAVFKTIQQYLGNKLHLSSGAVTFETVEAELRLKNIEQKVINDVKLIFEECDMIRYALGSIDQENMRKSHHRLAQSIDYLERHLK